MCRELQALIGHSRWACLFFCCPADDFVMAVNLFIVTYLFLTFNSLLYTALWNAHFDKVQLLISVK